LPTSPVSTPETHAFSFRPGLQPLSWNASGKYYFLGNLNHMNGLKLCEKEGGGEDHAGDGRSGAEDFASPVQDSLEIESGLWHSARRDSKEIRGVYFRYRQECLKNGGKRLKVQIFHYVPIPHLRNLKQFQAIKIIDAKGFIEKVKNG
jgi:hypothetical protein